MGSGMMAVGAGTSANPIRAHHGSMSRRRGWSWSSSSRPASCPRSSAPRRWNWASTSARWTWSCSCSRPNRSPRACSASAAPATWSGRPAKGAFSHPPRGRDGGRRRGRRHAARRGRADRHPAQPAGHPGTADRGHGVRRELGGRRTLSTWCAAPTPTRPDAARLPRRAGHAGRALSQPGAPGAAAADVVGSRSTTSWRRCPARG